MVAQNLSDRTTVLPASLSDVLRQIGEVVGEVHLTGPVVSWLLSNRPEISLVRGTMLVSGLTRTWDEGPVTELESIELIDAGTDNQRLIVAIDDTSLELGIRGYDPDDSYTHDTSGEVLNGMLADLARNRIVVDTMAIDTEGAVLDPFAGRDDMTNQRIRPMDSARTIFRTDPEVLLDVAVAVGSYGFVVDSETTRMATRDAANILSVDRKLWFEGIDRVLKTPYVDRALYWLFDTGVLSFLLPEVVSLVGFHKSCEVHHKDCWDHTIKVTKKASFDSCTRWTALCHDIGKIWTRTVDRRGQVHFYRHEEFGSILFEGIAARFKIPDELADRVSAVIRLHGRVNLYESDWTDSAVRRLVKDVEPYLEDLIRFSRADFTSKRAHRVREILRQLNELEVRIAEITAIDMREPPLPKGLGTLLISELAIPAGPMLGQIRKRLEALCDSGDIEPFRDHEYYVSVVRERGVEGLLS